MDPPERQAFEVEPVVVRLTSKVTALASHNNVVYVGSADGSVRMYTTQRNSMAEPGTSIVLVKRRAVTQMVAISDLNRLLVLCDGLITVHDLETLEKQHSAILEKGVSMFCMDQQGAPLHRMCAVRKKKVLIYEFSLGRFAYMKMLGLPDEPLSMAWYGDNLFVGYRREYNIIDGDGSVETIRVSIDSRTTPLIKFMPNKELLLAGEQQLGIYINLKGQPANRGTVFWSRPPSTVAYCFPYIVSLMPKTSYLEVHSWQNERTQPLVQQIQVEKGASCLCDGVLGTKDEDKGRNPVYFALPGKVMRLRPVAFERQVAYLVRTMKMDEAFSLIDNTTEESRKPAKLSRFHLDAGRVLYLDLQFEEAVTHLNSSPIDPREVIAMYPDLQPPNFAYRSKYFNASLLTAIKEGVKTPGDSATYVADAPGGEDGVPLPKAAGAASSLATSGAGSGAGAGAGAGSSYRESPPEFAASDGTGDNMHLVPPFPLVVAGVLKKKSQSVEGVAVDAVVKDSLRFLIHFLERRREQYHSVPIDPETMSDDEKRLHEALDTALLKAYAFRRKGTHLDAFVSKQNFVHLEDSVEFLMTHKLYHVVALLYKGHGDANNALAMWMKMGSGVHVERGHLGVKETVEYLSSLDDHQLVWKYSPWVLRADHKVAMNIFVKPTRSAPLPPDRVLEHLQGCTDLPVTELCQQYLEYLVNTQGSLDKRYHSQLAREYLARVLALRASVPDEVASGTHRVRCDPGSEEGMLGVMRGKLIRLLDSSDRYDVRLMLGATSDTTLYEERVILHSKVQEHKEALRLIVYELSNTSKAELYCEQQHLAGVPEGVEDPFLVLLNIYFADESRREDFTNAALDLLRHHGRVMDPVAVLQTLPKELPVKLLQPYLAQIIPSTAHKARHGQVVKSLYRYEHVRINCELIKEHKRKVVITADTFCGVCRRRLGEHMFAVYPNDTVVHMHCAQESLTCDPVTGTKFSQQKSIV